MRGSVIKAVALCVVSAAAGAAAMSVTIDTGDSDRTTSTGNFFVPDGGRETAAKANRERMRPAPVLTLRGDIGGRGSAADRLVEQAAADPRAALRAALEFDGYWHRLDTVERIVAVWARREPSTVLAYLQESAGFDPDARNRLLATAFAEWAGVDPDDVLSFLLTPRGQRLLFDERSLGHGIVREIAIARSGELLLAAGSLPRGEVRSSLRSAAIASLVERDLSFALRQAVIESPGLDKQQWIDNIIEYWTPRDPAGAFDWAKDFDPEAPGTLRNVAYRIAVSEPELTEALALCDLTPLAYYPLCEQ
jgi:hypothetical protein